MSHIEAFTKCKKVLFSCKTQQQLNSAERYYELYKKMYGYDFELHLIYQAKFLKLNPELYDNN